MITARHYLLALLLCSSQLDASPQQDLDGRIVPTPGTQAPVAQPLSSAQPLPPGQPTGGPVLFGCPEPVEFNIPTPGFNQLEPGLLFVPGVLPAGPAERPLLVVFHEFSVSHFAVTNTGFPAEACDRGWYIWGAGSRSPITTSRSENFGSIESQIFTKAGLDFVLNNYPIDRKRIYGVGFSMGGAQCMSYAARHQDPAAGMFAALVNHTGSIDQSDTWFSDPGARSLLESIFGGTPSLSPFPYRSASVIELDSITHLPINTGKAFANNLIPTPTQLWWATLDPWAYLVDQTTAYWDLQVQLQAPHIEMHPVASAIHQWDTLPYGEVCDWLEDKELQIANQGRVIADRDERWLYFDIAGIPALTFASFDYSIDLDNDLLEFLQCEDFTELQTDLADWNAGLPHALPLNVTVDVAVGGTSFVLHNVSTLPISVTRNGIPQAQDWTYDPVTQTLELTEALPGPQTWTFLP